MEVFVVNDYYKWEYDETVAVFGTIDAAIDFATRRSNIVRWENWTDKVWSGYAKYEHVDGDYLCQIIRKFPLNEEPE